MARITRCYMTVLAVEVLVRDSCYRFQAAIRLIIPVSHSLAGVMQAGVKKGIFFLQLFGIHCAIPRNDQKKNDQTEGKNFLHDNLLNLSPLNHPIRISKSLSSSSRE